MLEIGTYHTLRIDRTTKVGLFLTNETDEVLLPNKYIPLEYEIGGDITVFVYFDHEERPVATTLKPLVQKNKFAILKVNYINEFGAFLNWGLEKDLFVPFKEQARPMEVGKKYIIYMYEDVKTNRLLATSRINKHLLIPEKEEFQNGDEVFVMISHITDMGINVIVNEKYKGLAYKNEVFKNISPGTIAKAYIKNVREDGKIDISFQKQGIAHALDEMANFITILKKNNNFIDVNDQSSPEKIQSVFGISKKTYKKIVGMLYKEQKIVFENNGIRLKN